MQGMMTRVLIAGVAVLTLLIQGCAGDGVGGSCDKERPYQRSTEAPPLEVPPDLDPLDPDAAVVIPQTADQLQTTERKGDCIEAPPEFFQGDVEQATPPPPQNRDDDERLPTT